VNTGGPAEKMPRPLHLPEVGPCRSRPEPDGGPYKGIL
jgi:hypothetical protein